MPHIPLKRMSIGETFMYVEVQPVSMNTESLDTEELVNIAKVGFAAISDGCHSSQDVMRYGEARQALEARGVNVEEWDGELEIKRLA